MKKLLSLVLICAMGFGMISCVESDESQSVAALRNAKAEQLKALTNLYNAQAEAATIVAQAEAALKAAEAAYKENQTEEAKAKFAIEIAKIKAEAEAAIAKAKYESAWYEQQLLENASSHIKTLYTAYATALDDLTTANNDMVVAQANLVALKQNVITAEENADYWLGYYNKLIAGYEAQLEVLKDPKYVSMNKDSLYAAYGASNKAANLANSYYLNSDEKKAADEAEKAAREAGEKFFDEIDEMNGIYGSHGRLINIEQDNYNSETQWLRENNTSNRVISVYVDEVNLLSLKTDIEDDYNNWVKKWFGTEADEFDYDDPYNASYWAKYNYSVSQVAIAKELLPAVLSANDAAVKAIEAKIAAENDLDTANAKPETTDAEKAAKKTAVEAAEKTLEAAKETVATTAKALDKYTGKDANDEKKDGSFRQFISELMKTNNPFAINLTNSNDYTRYENLDYIDANPRSYDVVEVDKDGNKTTKAVEYYLIYNRNVEALQKAVDKCEAYISDEMNYEKANAERRTENYENFNAFASELRDFVAAKVEEIAKVEALMAAYRTAEEAREAAYEEVNKLYAESDVLWNLYSNAVDIAAEIRSVERFIEQYKHSIAQYEKNFADAEAQVALVEAQIEDLKTKIAALEIIVENAKAALDAAISAQNAE